MYQDISRITIDKQCVHIYVKVCIYVYIEKDTEKAFVLFDGKFSVENTNS